jgi:hypothetical protein
MTLDTDTGLPAGNNRNTLTIQVESLLSRLYPPVERERRHDDRVAIPVLFRLTPLDSDRQPVDLQSSIVVGKNISRRGVSFYHEKPITQRRVLIELADPNIVSFVAEVDVTWCRFTKPGWYESGGRLIRSAAPRTGLSTIDEPDLTVGILDLSSPLPSVEPITGT